MGGVKGYAWLINCDIFACKTEGVDAGVKYYAWLINCDIYDCSHLKLHSL